MPENLLEPAAPNPCPGPSGVYLQALPSSEQNHQTPQLKGIEDNDLPFSSGPGWRRLRAGSQAQLISEAPWACAWLLALPSQLLEASSDESGAASSRRRRAQRLSQNHDKVVSLGHSHGKCWTFKTKERIYAKALKHTYTRVPKVYLPGYNRVIPAPSWGLKAEVMTFWKTVHSGKCLSSLIPVEVRREARTLFDGWEDRLQGPAVRGQEACGGQVSVLFSSPHKVSWQTCDPTPQHKILFISKNKGDLPPR